MIGPANIAGALGDKRVILVGGVSGSGKSVFAAALAAALPDYSLVKLDWIYDGLHASRRHGVVKRSRRSMARLAPNIVAEIVADGGRVIIEGGWIEPRVWQRLTADDPAAHAFFLGYPDASVAELAQRLNPTVHWLSGGTGADQSFLVDQIRHSKRLRRKLAGRAGGEFIDVSRGFVSLSADGQNVLTEIGWTAALP